MIQKIKAFLEKFFVKESCILIGTEILETHGLPLWASFGGTSPFNQNDQLFTHQNPPPNFYILPMKALLPPIVT